MFYSIGITARRLSTLNLSQSTDAFLISFFLVCFHQSANACSMYKATVEGKTMVGCNEDAWRTTPRIWFENSKDENGHGACSTESREIGIGQFAPQSGMNEEGLVFSRLLAYHPNKNLNQKDKKKSQMKQSI